MRMAGGDVTRPPHGLRIATAATPTVFFLGA
jgi:hypothetical protein